mmetsp:Transcript_13375/g.26930  ORF Transcript_13375/g.26930 Transcript_13375/m.26930 type:complete len:107 (-) Transcript_13375:11-331(-)
MGDVPDVSLQLIGLKKEEQSEVSAVTVDFEGRDEVVMIHAEHGPIINRLDGTVEYLQHYLGRVHQSPGNMSAPKVVKRWSDLTVTESEILAHLAAQMNRRLKGRLS